MIEDPRCVTSQNIMHEKTPRNYKIDSDDGCSSPRKKKREKVTVSKSAPRNKWKESNSELSEDECEQRRGNKRVKRSTDLQQAINNAKKDHTKINLIDTGYEGKYLKWFTVSSANGRGRKYKVEIAESIKCTCEFFNQKNTPCKYIIYIYLYVFNIPESSYIIQQMFVTKTELRKLYSSQVKFTVLEATALTTRALLQSSSNISKFRAPIQPQVKLSNVIPTKPSLPEPQNGPYWILKSSGHIKKCHGYEEEVGEHVIGRWEVDYYPRVDKQICTIYWASKVEAFYYHLNVGCLRKRRPNVLLRLEDFKVSEGLTLTGKMKEMLFGKIP